MPYTVTPTTDFELHCGDAAEVLRDFDDDSVDLIFTSPPYAERRKNSYGGVHADDYVEWFLTISKELLRVMKPSGSFVLNIKEHAANGERHTYVIELILALKQQGWLWTEEYMWHKKNSYPGKWPQSFPRFLGETASLQQNPPVQDEPRRCHGANGRLDQQSPGQLERNR